MGELPPCSTFYSNLDTRTLKVLKGHRVLAGKCPITLQRMWNIHNSLAKSEHYDVITVRIVTYEDEAWKFKPESIRPPRCTSVYEVREKNRFVSGKESMRGLLCPGEEIAVPLISIPPEDAQTGDCEEVIFELRTMMDDLYIPVDGFTYQSCVVESTGLTCISPGGNLLREALSSSIITRSPSAPRPAV